MLYKGKHLFMKILLLLKQIVFVGSIIIGFNPMNTAIANDNWDISIQGIRIIGSGYKSAADEITPFNQFKGSAIACLLEIKTGKIISFSEVESTVKEFKDNTGTNLLDPNAMFGNGFGFMRNISQDRSALMFEIAGSNLPDNKATSLQASGEIVINMASTSESLFIENVNVKKGTIINTPVGNIKISNITKNDWGDLPVEIVFESNKNLSVIKNIEFTDNDGQIIKSDFFGEGNHNIVGDLSSLVFERNYVLSSQPQNINLKIDYWTDFKPKKIPFSIFASVGL